LRKGILGLGEYIMSASQPKIILDDVDEVQSSMYHCFAINEKN
jgi:hypothetical protein